MVKVDHDNDRRKKLQEKYTFLKPTYLNGLMCGDGWLKILEDLFEEFDKIEKVENFRVIQVKESVGGLRINVSGYNTAIERAIKKAEKRAYKTCEICGKRGKNREHGSWWKTTCQEHFEKREACEL